MAFERRTSLVLGGALFGAALSVFDVGAASAQIGNQAFRPGSGVGLSSAGRQAILNDRLLGSRPSNLVRGADGSLLDVGRSSSSDQAFARSPVTGSILQNARSGVGWPTGLGTGLGWGGPGLGWGGIGSGGGGIAYGYGRSGFAADSMMQWISMLDRSALRSDASFSPPASASATPLDIWIGQREWE